VSESASSFLTAHQHKTGHSVYFSATWFRSN